MEGRQTAWPQNIKEDLWQELYHQKGEMWFRLLSDSMAPLIRAGDKVLVQPTSKINFGDIVLFRQADKLIVHRVLSRGILKQGVTILQKGDNYNYPTPIAPERISGKVTAIKRGTLLLKLDTFGGRILNNCLAAISYLKSTIYKYFRLVEQRVFGPRRIPLFYWWDRLVRGLFYLPSLLIIAIWKSGCRDTRP